MRTLYALLVGIDTYRLPGARLAGCRNDIDAVHVFLTAQHATGTRLAVRPLYDEDATREAVIDGFRSHLGQAGPDDAALFWFSGHGSRATVGRELWHLEPSGELQTLVCVDSRIGGVPDLLDKELSVLIDEVAARKAHVAVVLDSCHSAGADRDLDVRVRAVPPATLPPTSVLLPELRTAGADEPRPVAGRRIALAACRSFERAHELTLDGGARGLFSWALLRAMGRLGPAATYRQLLTAARCDVEAWYPTQAPQLDPVDGDLADEPFLGGEVVAPAPAMVMRYVQGWEIDAGSCHGLPSTVDAEVRVAVHDPRPPVREAAVSRVLTTRSEVEPIRWRPDPDRQYPVVVSDVPVAPTRVAVEDGGYPELADRVRAALDRAGPGGRPSPHARLAPPGPTGPAELRVVFPEPRLIRVTGRDDRPLCPDIVDSDGGGAIRAVRVLEHIARWRALKGLANPRSGLAYAVSLEIVPEAPNDVLVPYDRPALLPGADGVIELTYRRTAHGWMPPSVFVRLHNRSGQRLFCVLLDLTDRYRCHAALFPGADIGPGVVTGAVRGRRVRFTLPAGRPVHPGATGEDWLKLLVAEEQFSAGPFDLPALGEPEPLGSRAPLALSGILDRLGRIANHRDAGADTSLVAADWATTMLPIRTRVPD